MPTDVPPIGLGTYKQSNRAECVDSVGTALDVGYCHVDTAQYYDNERFVGEGLAAADADSSDVFVATKLWHDQLAPETVSEAARESRDRLGVPSIDLLYVHWPAGEYSPEETLGAFDELRADGVIEHVGVSNFTPELLNEARAVADSPIVANQVEMHPLLQQRELHEYAVEHDLTLVAYSPLARGTVTEVPELVEIGAKHGVSAAQVSIAWLCGKEKVVPIPKATGREHIAANYEARTLDLDADDVERIESIERTERTATPSFAPDW